MSIYSCFGRWLSEPSSGCWETPREEEEASCASADDVDADASSVGDVAESSSMASWNRTFWILCRCWAAFTEACALESLSIPRSISFCCCNRIAPSSATGTSGEVMERLNPRGRLVKDPRRLVSTPVESPIGCGEGCPDDEEESSPKGDLPSVVNPVPTGELGADPISLPSMLFLPVRYCEARFALAADILSSLLALWTRFRWE